MAAWAIGVRGRVGGWGGRIFAASLATVVALFASSALAQARGTREARRVVSMNPSLTRTLLALGAVDRLVGVDAFSAETEPQVGELPRVGGLYNPSLEAVVALEPDLVVVVPSVAQRDFRSRLRDFGIEVLELPNITLDEALRSIEFLGERVGRTREAQVRVAEVRRVWREVSRESAQRPRRSAVLIIQRDPLYVAGAGSFLDEMLRASGIENVAARYAEPYPRVAVEWLIDVAPEIIIDSADDATSAKEYWSRWPSLPAVSEGRVVEVPRGIVTLPGPFLDRSLRTLVAAIRAAEVGATPGRMTQDP